MTSNKERRHSPKRDIHTAPSPNDAYDIRYFKRHVDDDHHESSPGREYLNGCPATVRAKFKAVLTQVATAPPTRFAGGGYWEAMHGEMRGWYEVRIDYRRVHYRLFCRLDLEAKDCGALLTIIAGMTKSRGKIFTSRQYAGIRALGDEYLSRNPRSIA